MSRTAPGGPKNLGATNSARACVYYAAHDCTPGLEAWVCLAERRSRGGGDGGGCRACGGRLSQEGAAAHDSAEASPSGGEVDSEAAPAGEAAPSGPSASQADDKDTPEAQEQRDKARADAALQRQMKNAELAKQKDQGVPFYQKWQFWAITGGVVVGDGPRRVGRQRAAAPDATAATCAPVRWTQGPGPAASEKADERDTSSRGCSPRWRFRCCSARAAATPSSTST